MDLALEARGAAAWAALLLLPGLLVVRAPWTAVPLLSTAFWITSWGWSGLLDVPRPRFVATVLAAQGALALLRLAKPWGWSRPGLPALLVLAVALAGVAAGGWAPGPPAPEGSLLALTGRLLVWHQSLPATYEPLLPVHDFALQTVGLPALAADVSLLSGLPPARSAALVSATVPGLLLLACFGALARRLPAGSAAGGALLATAVSVALGAWGGTVSGQLAAALVVAAGGWLLVAPNRSPVVAAGLLAAAALLADGAAAVFGLGPVVALTWTRGGDGRDRPPARLAWAAGMATLAVLPVAWPLATLALSTLGPREVGAAAGVVAGVAAGLAAGWAAAGRSTSTARVALLAALAAGAVLTARAAGERHLPRLTDLDAADWIAEQTPPLATFCVGADGGRWVPALAGRGIRPAGALPGLPEGLRQSPAAGACDYVYGAPAHAGAALYRNAEVAITRSPATLTTFDSSRGNDRPRLP
jgi:hypothetical protein